MIKKFLTIFTVVALAIACSKKAATPLSKPVPGSGPGGKTGSAPKNPTDPRKPTPPGDPNAKTQLEGEWSTDCLSDDSGDSVFWQYYLTIHGNGYSYGVLAYTDSSCSDMVTDPDYSYYSEGTLSGIAKDTRAGAIDGQMTLNWNEKNVTYYDIFNLSGDGNYAKFGDGDGSNISEDKRPTNWGKHVYNKQRAN